MPMRDLTPHIRPFGRVVEVSITTAIESGKGKSWWVTLTNDLGQTMTPMMSYKRANALIEATTWGDFLGIVPTPFYEDGALVEADFIMGKYRDCTRA